MLLRICLEPVSPCEEQRHEKPRIGVWDGLVLGGRTLAKPLPGVDLDWFIRLLLGNMCWSIGYLYGFAWEDVRWVAPAAHPTSFILPKVYGQAAWPMGGAMRCWFGESHGGMVRCDCVGAS